MPLVMKDVLTLGWPDLSEGHGRYERKIRHLRPVAKRYLRKNRVRYMEKAPKPGHVHFTLNHIWIPASLDRRLRQLAVIDDRSLAELAALGLTWVATYYAASRYPDEELESVRPYRVYAKTFRGRRKRRSRNPRPDPLTTIKMVEEGREGGWRVLAK